MSKPEAMVASKTSLRAHEEENLEKNQTQRNPSSPG